MPISSRSTTAPNTSSACRARPAICRAARSTAATCSRRRAGASIRCRRCMLDQAGVIFEAAAKKLGYHPFSTPRAILSQPYKGRPGCTYCGFCQAFGCHVGAKSSILVTKLPEADATGNFKLITGAMCYRVNSDNSGRVTGVSYYGPDGSRQHDRGRARHPRAVHLRQYAPAAAVEDGQVPQRPRQFERPGRQAPDGASSMRERVRRASTTGTSTSTWGRARRSTRSTISTPTISTTADLGFIRGSQISVGTAEPRGRPDRRRQTMKPPPGIPRWGAAYRDFFAKYYARHAAMVGADREPALRRPDHRSRSQRARCVGPAGAAPDL